MKKNLLFLGLGLFLSFSVMGQLDTTGYVNYLKNGDFEEQGVWKIAVNDGEADDVTWEFGVSPGIPNGEDACLEVSWDMMSTPLNQILYQTVKVAIGDTFWFDGAFKNSGTPDDVNQLWYQIIILPVYADNDSSADDGILSAPNAWQDNDATILLNHARGWSVDWLSLDKTTTFVEDMNPDAIYGHNIGIGDFDGQGDTNIYIVPDTLFWYEPDTYTVLGEKGDSIDLFVALQVGQWMEEGSGIVNSFDFKFDSFVLLGPQGEPSAVPENSAPEVYIYPNPVGSSIHIKSPLPVQNIRLFNLLGQEIVTMNGLNDNTVELNVSSLEKGIYILSVEDVNGNVHKEKIMKK